MSIGVLLGKQLAKAIKGTGDNVADETVEALGKTSAKPERFDPEALKSAANQNDKSREILVDMPIEDFLRVSEKVSPDDPARVDSRKVTKELVEKGTPFRSIPSLTFENLGDGTAKATGHEGRHRAMALLAAGEDTIPVVLKSSGGKGGSIRWGQQSDPDSFDYIDVLPDRLKSEDTDDVVPMPDAARNIRKKASAENIRSLVQRPIKDPVIKTPKIPESLKKFVKDGYYTDKNTGEPKKLYHGLGGTLRGEATNFEGINLRTTDSGTLGEGVYLSTDPKVGSDFAMDLRAGREEARMGGQVIPVYVKTPYIADSNLINNNDPWRDWLIKLYDSYFDKKRGHVSNIGKLKNKKLDFDHYLAKDVFNGEEEARHLEKMYNKLHDKKDINLGDFFTYQPKGSKGTNEIDFGKYIRKQLENSAIGGITINSAKGFSETVIFNPKDIKSALQGSKGKYDPDNPDMLLNTGGLVERPNK